MKKSRNDYKASLKSKKKNDIRQKIKKKITSIKQKHNISTVPEDIPTIRPPKSKPLRKIKEKKLPCSQEKQQDQQQEIISKSQEEELPEDGHQDIISKSQEEELPEDGHQDIIAKLLPAPAEEEEEDIPELDTAGEDEEEMEDYSQMDKFVEKVTGKKAKTNFTLGRQTGGSLKMDCVGSVINNAFQQKASQLAKKKKKLKLGKALHKHEVVKLKRGIAYEREKEELTKWDDIVETNREAPQMAFPLKQPSLAMKPEPTQLLESSNLEKKVAEILRKHQDTTESAAPVKKVEEAMDINQAILRQKEVQKARALLIYQAMAGKRQNKIKSKRNRKFEKIRKLKLKAQEIEQLMKDDPEEAKRRLKEEADRERIRERITLKHKNTSKWAKMMKLQAKHNPEAREALEEQLQIGQQLTQKTLAPEDEEEENNGSEESGDEQPAREEYNQGFMNIKTNKAKAIDCEKAKALFNEMMNKDKQEKKEEASKNADASQNSYRVDFMEDSGLEKTQKITMAIIDQDNQSRQEFQKEKERVVEKTSLKDLDLFLPGWNSWTGPAVKESARKRQRYLFKAPKAPPRKDQKLSHVIISEEKSGVSKHQVKAIPFPFQSEKQFEASIRQPIGRNWCTETSLQELTAPAVVAKKGVAITPISKDVLKDV